MPFFHRGIAMEKEEQQPRWLRFLLLITAAVGALGTIGTTLFLFFPKLKPLEPPQKKHVILSDLRYELQQRGDSAVVIFFRAQIDGYQGTTLPVMWTLYDAKTNTPVDTWPLNEPPLGPYTVRHKGGRFAPTVESESFDGEVRIPGRPVVRDGDPPRTWRVKLEVIDPSGKRLD
jgi:hypothetical protein